MKIIGPATPDTPVSVRVELSAEEALAIVGLGQRIGGTPTDGSPRAAFASVADGLCGHYGWDKWRASEFVVAAGTVEAKAAFDPGCWKRLAR